MGDKKINVLGTQYLLMFRTEEENAELKECNGYCDYSSKKIVVLKEKRKDDDIRDFVWMRNKTVRHEIVHAFLSESGLLNNTYNVDCGWSFNEEMVDWIAIQFHKMMKIFQELEVL